MSMKLADFIAEEHKRVDQFAAYWMAHSLPAPNNKSDPDDCNWPLEMDPGEWDEALTDFDAQAFGWRIEA